MIFNDIIEKIFIISIIVSNVSTESSFCGNWTQYKEEKCVLILNEENFLNFEDSVKACLQTDNSVLLTINSKEEQEFIAEFLFKTHKTDNNIWIGLKKSSNAFQWIDNSDTHYTNWANGSPSNTIDNNCTEISSEAILLGKWIDERCSKKNLVVCQKTPKITDLLKTINEMKNELNETKAQLNETKAQLNVCKHSSFNNRSNYSKTFIDDNGKQKAFIIPMNEKGGYDRFAFNDAVNYCAKFNSTLIELQSQQKQTIYESFMREIVNSQSFTDNSFWMNGRKDSSGKWKWINSGNDFTFTNWKSGEPDNVNGDDYVFIHDWTNDGFFNDGKWGTDKITQTYYVMCELELKI